jgi:Zn-dependent peptidase ImmA (M78 family)
VRVAEEWGVGTFGERLSMMRKAAGLSMRELAARAGISHNAIARYERGEMMPGSAVLVRLASALDVGLEPLLRPTTATVGEPAYHKRSRLSVRLQEQVRARIQEEVERHLEAEALLPLDDRPVFRMPDIDRTVGSLEQVERAATDLRRAWDLGSDSVESVVEILEEHGVKVVMVDAPETFDGCAYWVNQVIPVIAVRTGMTGDRQRFSLLRELGHLVVECAAGLDSEKASMRFAGAFLVPRQMVRMELGGVRHNLDEDELLILKHRYGMSVQAWIYRARDLGIVSSAVAVACLARLSAQGQRRREPGDQIPEERSARLEQMVRRAWAEEIIGDMRAAELLGVALGEFHRIGHQADEVLPVAACR